MRTQDKLALDGGKPVHTGGWPEWPQWDQTERRALLDVLESGKWWFGAKGEEFGAKFAKMHGAKHGIPVTNGAQAAELALRAIGIRPGDEVIVPPYTFVATATCVIAVNGVPVFADIDPATLNLDPRAVERAITTRTRAIMPVHMAGLPADMDALRRIAKRHKLAILEDACHAWGSQWRGRGVGALGDAGVFSFQHSKNLTAGEGGIILTNSDAIADACRCLRHCGRDIRPGAVWYEHVLPGGNHRMTEFQAAILLSQLARYPSQLRRRAQNAGFLNRELANLPMIGTVTDDDPRVTRRSYHLYIFRYLGERQGGWTRQKFLDALRAEGVPCTPGYPKPLYQVPLFRRKNLADRYPFSDPKVWRRVRYDRASCPGTELLCREAVWFTQSTLLGAREDMKDIVRAMRKVLTAMGA